MSPGSRCQENRNLVSPVRSLFQKVDGSNSPGSARKGKAVYKYAKFLTLREGADPGLREVEDTRKRLAGLTGS